MGMRLGKIAGTLQELSGEELARQQGLSAAPPTPLGAQGIGASQDVAKMAGTPNQIRTMVQDSLMERQRTRDLLGESERTNGRARYSVESLQEKMNVLEGLGSLEGRIPEYVRTKLQTATTVSVPNTTNADAITKHLASLGITDKASVDAAAKAVEAVRSAGATPEQVSAALKALKIDATITDGTTTLAGKLAPFFTDATVDDIKKQISTVLQDFSDVKMKELPEEFARFADQQNNVDDVAAILGLTDEQFGDMTLGEVRAQLKAWKTRNFQDVEILRDVLQDPSYSMAEKDFARQRLAEMGAVGVTSIEQKTNNLEAQVAEGDTVVVGGQAVKVSELMSDPKLKATIATALESDDELAKLEKTDKDLANWIRNNKAALVPVRNELLKGTEQFAQNNKVFADNMADLVATHKTFLDSVIPGWNTAKDISWTEWLGSPAAGETPAKGLYATAPTMAHVLTMPDKAKRGLALSALSKLPPEQAKSFSPTFLDQIAGAATTDVEAQQFMTAFLGTEDKDWQAGITVDTVSVPRDEDFTDADYTAAVNTVLQEFAPEFKTIEDLVNKINTLRTGGPKDRAEAIRLSGVLANVKGSVTKALRPENIDKVKQQNRTTRLTKSFNDANAEVGKFFTGVTEALKGRGEDYLRARGLTVFMKINSEMKSLPSKVKEGTISYEDGIKQMNALKGRMAGEMAAFLFDKNHRDKSPEAALDAMQILRTTGLSGSLADADRNGIRKTLQDMVTTYQQFAARTNNAAARNRFNQLATRAASLSIDF